MLGLSIVKNGIKSLFETKRRVEFVSDKNEMSKLLFAKIRELGIHRYVKIDWLNQGEQQFQEVRFSIGNQVVASFTGTPNMLVDYVNGKFEFRIDQGFGSFLRIKFANIRGELSIVSEQDTWDNGQH